MTWLHNLVLLLLVHSVFRRRRCFHYQGEYKAVNPTLVDPSDGVSLWLRLLCQLDGIIAQALLLVLFPEV